MKTSLKTAMIASILLVAMVVTSQASNMEQHHSGDESSMSSDGRHDMMMQKMEKMQGKDMMGNKSCMMNGSPCSKPCMATTSPRGKHHKKGAGMSGMMAMDHSMMNMDTGMMGMKPGMMQQRMDRTFFLDRVDSLALTPDQVSRLKSIRSECRKENIRNAAEAKISRLDLKDLLDDTDWSLKTAEALIRKIQALKGDMQVRHLQAIKEARSVLSAEQLQKVDGGGDNDDLESLFD